MLGGIQAEMGRLLAGSALQRQDEVPDFQPQGDFEFPGLGIDILLDAPLRLATLAGLLTSTMALLYILWILLEKYRGHNLPGWSAVMTAVLFLGGIQLLCTGLQGLYISSIFQESKGRPNYIVKDTFGFKPGTGKRRSEQDGKRLTRET